MPFPLSQPPEKPKTWWGTIAGQLSIVVVAGGAVLIFLELAGAVNFHP